MIDTEVREASDVRRDAHRLLESNGWPVDQVVAVDRDSVLFLNALALPRTAWIYIDPRTAKQRFKVVAGFQAEPPADWPPTAV